MTYSPREGKHTPQRASCTAVGDGPEPAETLPERFASVAEHLRRLVKGGHDAAFVVRGNGHTLWPSASASHLFGHRPEVLRGKSVFSFFDDRDQLSVFRSFADMVSRGTSYAAWKARLRLKDGPQWHEARPTICLPRRGASCW